MRLLRCAGGATRCASGGANYRLGSRARYARAAAIPTCPAPRTIVALAVVA